MEMDLGHVRARSYDSPSLSGATVIVDSESGVCHCFFVENVTLWRSEIVTSGMLPIAHLVRVPKEMYPLRVAPDGLHGLWTRTSRAVLVAVCAHEGKPRECLTVFTGEALMNPAKNRCVESRRLETAQIYDVAVEDGNDWILVLMSAPYHNGQALCTINVVTGSRGHCLTTLFHKEGFVRGVHLHQGSAYAFGRLSVTRVDFETQSLVPVPFITTPFRLQEVDMTVHDAVYVPTIDTVFNTRYLVSQKLPLYRSSVLVFLLSRLYVLFRVPRLRLQWIYTVCRVQK